MPIPLTLRELQMCPSSPAILRALAEEHDRRAEEEALQGRNSEGSYTRAGELRAEAQRIENCVGAVANG